MLVAAGVCLPLFLPTSTFCGPAFANFGQGISGVVSVVTMPLLVLTLLLQTKGIAEAREIREQDLAEKSFEAHCKSIESGLMLIKNQAGNIEGGAAIIRYGELCAKGTLTFEATTNELTVDALKSVVAALSDLIDWIDKPKNRFKFHSFFRVRFMSFIIGFEKMLPDGVMAMIGQELFSKYGTDAQRYPLILAIHRLHKKEFYSWTNYEEAKGATT